MTNTSNTTPPSGKIKIVFFGTGPVAARSLELLRQHFDIEAVVTKPKPAHHMHDAPVLLMAEQHHLPLITAGNKAELDAVITARHFESQLAILIDFGIIVSRTVIDAFPLGIINSHFSLLPRWRGADPITFAILSGDTKTGVSLMLIDEGMDTGKLLTYRTLHMNGTETSISLTDRLISLSNELLAEFVPKYVTGEIKPKNQPHPNRATYSRKLTKQDGIIDWAQPAEQIERNIRGFIAWPGSRTTLNTIDIIITSTNVVKAKGTPGTYTTEGKSLVVYAGKNALSLQTVKPAGKKEMPVAAFLAGYSKYL